MVAQQFKTQAAVPEGLSSVPSTQLRQLTYPLEIQLTGDLTASTHMWHSLTDIQTYIKIKENATSHFYVGSCQQSLDASLRFSVLLS